MVELRDLFAREGPFASVVLDVSLDSENAEREIQARVREATDRLTELGAPRSVVERLRETLDEPVHQSAPQSRFVVVGADAVLMDEVLPERTTTVSATWGALPDVGRWLTSGQERTSVLLVSVDHTGGSVTTYDSQRLDVIASEEIEGEEEYVHKVRGGGMAHRRFQASAEEVWRDNAKEVAAVALERVRAGEHLVVVAGSPESRGDVVAALDGSPADVVVLDRAGEKADGGDESLQLALRTVVEQHLEESRRALLERLEQGLGQGSTAVAGTDAVLEAFVKGQVDTLVIDLAALAEESVRPADHPGLELPGVGDDRVRADLALVASAVRTDAKVVAKPHGLKHSVAALLRWEDQPA